MDCLIIGCDGVFDVLSNNQVATIAFTKNGDAMEASKAIAEEAYKRGSTDNITVVV